MDNSNQAQIDSLSDKNLHPLDKPMESSVRDLEEFIEHSLVWHDLSMAIHDRIEILTNELILTDDQEEIRSLQHEIRVWKEASALPYYLLEWVKIEQQINEENDAED